MHKGLTILSIFTVIFFSATSSVFAVTHDKNNVVLPSGEVIDDDYFAAGDTITVSGTVQDDAYVAGGVVTISGAIGGDLLAAGGVVNVLGTVEDDVRVAGGQVIISGDIGGNITVAAGSVTITDEATVAGSVVGGGGSMMVFAPVQNLVIGAGQLTIANEVTGDVQAGVGALTLMPDVVVGGDLSYFSEEEALFQQGATVSGQIQRQEPVFDTEDIERGREVAESAAVGASWSLKIINIISVYLFGVLLLKFFPRYLGAVSDRITDRTWQSLGVGVLFVVFAPVLALILLITLIGLPFAMILLFAYFFYLYLAKLFVSYVLGKKIIGLFDREYSPYLTLAVGLLAYLFVSSVPVIGWLVVIATVFMGTGAVFLAKKDYYSLMKDKKLV